MEHKRASSERPSTTKTKGGRRHRKCASMIKDPDLSSLLRVNSFGIQGYKVPLCGLKPRGDKHTKFLKTKYNNFISEYVKSREFIPPPTKYNVNRSLIIKNKRMHFSKLARITMTEDIIKQAKKSKVGPGQYKVKDKRKIRGVFKSTDK